MFSFVLLYNYMTHYFVRATQFILAQTAQKSISHVFLIFINIFYLFIFTHIVSEIEYLLSRQISPMILHENIDLVTLFLF